MTEQIIRSGKKPIFITGHRNPDTDSVCAAITYAELKNKLTGDNYVACCAGQPNEETMYALTYFGVDDPLIIRDVRARVRDMNIRRVDSAVRGETLRSVGSRMKDANMSSLCVTENGILIGLISAADVVSTLMEMEDPYLPSRAHTPFSNMLEVLNGELICGDKGRIFDHGRTVMISLSDEIDTILDKGDIAVLDARLSDIAKAILRRGVSGLILCGGGSGDAAYIKELSSTDTVVIHTDNPPVAAVNLLMQSIPVDYVMRKEKLTTFYQDDIISDIRDIMASTRYKYFPVVDRRGHYIGMVSHRNFMDASRKKLILVDHNEKSQSVKGIEEAEILEIIDHHRLGNIDTSGPIYCRNQPVGSTCTIIWLMYRENGIDIDRSTAGLLLSAILSDTLILRSPTCTAVDREAVQALSAIAGVQPEGYARDMFRAGAKLDDKNAQEIVHLDYKQYTIDGKVIGIGQVNSLSIEELTQIRKCVQPKIDDICRADGLNMLFLMLTNIVDESTFVLYSGEKAHSTLCRAFGTDADEEDIMLPGVVSRKKQFLSALLEVMQH